MVRVLLDRTFNRIETSAATARTVATTALMTALPIPFASNSDWPMKIPRNTIPGTPCLRSAHAVAITTTLDFAEWSSVFGDA